MLVLGLDPSVTAYGWVLIDSSRSGQGRVIKRGRWDTSSQHFLLDRFLYLRESLGELVRETRPEYIGIESEAYNESWSEGMFGLQMYSLEALKAQGCSVVRLSAGQCKARARRFLGRPEKPKKWKMGKPDMVEAARKLTDGGRWNHNEADALWVAEVAFRFWSFMDGHISQDDLDDIELHQFTRTRTPTRGKNAGRIEEKGIIFKEGERYFRWGNDNAEND